MQAGKQSRQTIRRNSSHQSKTIVTGCYATSDEETVRKIDGVDGVITHHQNLESELTRLLDSWLTEPLAVSRRPLPLLNDHQDRQRAFLKIQDGCDAHCTYCIIPQLRPNLSSKPVDETIEEAKRLVAAGHHEIILTGIFLGAYGQPTALRRRQPQDTAIPLARLIDALCTNVPNLRRLRLSSLEPGDVTPHLIDVMKSHQQVVPHFHLPLQSGSDHLLHKMNRQYTRTDFLKMADQLNESFDRPALTTDIITGFPGETDEEFQQTLDVVNQVKFIHIHAFPFSPRPKTAAARWTKDFIRGPVVNERIQHLTTLAQSHSHTFRTQFLTQTAEVLVEKSNDGSIPHGRSERYFDIHFDSESAKAGDLVKVRIERVTPTRTHGTLVNRPLPILV